MKSLTAAIVALGCAAAVFAEPEITALTVSQNSSRLVTIDFTLTEKAIVTLDMTTNGVSIGPDNYRLLHDAQSDSTDYPANKVLSAGRHVFMWRATKDWPNHIFNNGEFAVDLKAFSLSSPPDYMVVDLTTKSNRWFYASVADLPYGGIKTADPNDAEAVAELTNDVYRTTKLVMRRIPAAGNKWRMGSPTSETTWRSDTEVLHYVTLTEDYYIGIYSLTKWQVNAVGVEAARSTVAYNNISYSYFRGNPTTSTCNWPSDGHAVDSSTPMQSFRARTGVMLDFPTEAQWEYACRAGTSGALNDGSGAFDAEKGDALGWSSRNATTVMTVGLLKPNDWGLYDMHGNVWEWCLDQWGTPASTPQIDPKGAEDNVSTRVLKGGTCKTSLVRGRSAARRGDTIDRGYDSGFSGFIGVRLCCPITEVAE